MKPVFHRAIFIAAILPILSVTALACTCVQGISVDKQYDDAKVVGIFKFQSKGIKWNEKGHGERIVNFTTEKVYKGDIKVGQTIAVPEWGNNACPYYFGKSAVGDEFLLFPDPGPNSEDLWTVHVCTGSKRLGEAPADLLYLDKLAAVRGKTRLYGTITANWRKESRTEPISDLPVTISGDGKIYHLKTDRNGVYEIYGLPPGEYRVTPASIDGWDEFNKFPVSAPTIIKPRAGTVLNFRYYPNGLKLV
jgi:hypothetical protein